MTDMLGNQIAIGDLVLYPGGNARYGGLKMICGVVSKMTAKRVSLLGGPLVADGKPFKTTNKTGAKILVCKELTVLNSNVVVAIKDQLKAND
jgi:hypothetical protein